MLRSIPPNKDDKYKVDVGRRIRSLDEIISSMTDNPTVNDYTDGRIHEEKNGNMAMETDVSYKDIGGMDDIIVELDLLINGIIKYPATWKRLGGKKIRGILLSGPPGCGKTLLAQAIAAETQRKHCIVQGSEIHGGLRGASEHNLIAAYKSIQPNGILIIDEVDAIGGKRDQMVNETYASVVGTLLSLLDGAKYKDNVVVIGTTNVPYMLDSALRRRGRFDQEIPIPPPTVEGRKQIFEIHLRTLPRDADVDTEILAQRSHGFTGSDIAGVCAELNARLLKQAITLIKSKADDAAIARLSISQKECMEQIAATVPSVLREHFFEVSSVRWEQIGGLDEVKKELQRIALWPLVYKDRMQTLNLRMPKGMLLYGPPGVGKTLLAKAIATQSEYNFLAVNGPALLSKWIGSTEEAIRDLFAKARQAVPCIIFFDEMEALAPSRGKSMGNDVTDRATSQILAEIDGVRSLSDVFVIAATNRPDLIDPALLRPGRLDLQFEITPPDCIAREHIFRIHLDNVPLHNVNIKTLASQSDTLTGASIEWVCTQAKQVALERSITSPDARLWVTQQDLKSAIAHVKTRAY